MRSAKRYNRLLGTVTMLLAVLLILLAAGCADGSSDQEKGAEPAAATPAAAPATYAPAETELPVDGAFQSIAESETLHLYADAQSGHFQIRDKRDGQVWHSYPSPQDWEQETVGGAWREHLRSPVLVEYVDLSQPTSHSTVSSVLHQKGGVAAWDALADGFRVRYDLPGIELAVTVEVKLKDDYVEITLPEDALQEGRYAVLNLKVYPFFGALHSPDSDSSAQSGGYMLLPDGSGAIHRFKQEAGAAAGLYKEPIYGVDDAFSTVYTGRNPVIMPVLGMNNGRGGFVAVAVSGAEYGSIFASPAGVYSSYNWLTVEHAYRLQYFQPTSSGKAEQGFSTYSRDSFAGERSVRYYLLADGQGAYANMAARYRTYLLEETELRPRIDKQAPLPLYLDLIGGDIEQGLLWDRYISGTTAEQAEAIVARLSEAGISGMTITYRGWQQDGASTLAFRRKMDRRLGGQEALADFIEAAQQQGHRVYLEVDYSLHGGGLSFRPRVQGAQSQSGRVLSWYEGRSDSEITLVSPRYSLERFRRDLTHYADLGADGLQIGGIGMYLSSDFNPRYRATRSETAALQQTMMQDAQARGLEAGIAGGLAYTWADSEVIRLLPDDYSYDVFIDEAVPFAQIVLHGVIPYTSTWGNTRDEQRLQWLRSVEYGASPAFVVMHEETQKMKHAFSIWMYSMQYEQWEARITAEYERYRQALEDVQAAYIVDHRKRADKVMETTYSGGKRIVVNYNQTPVSIDGITIAAYDFAVFEGEGTP